MPSIEVSGGTLHYEISGQGETLVLVPGFASGAWSWSWQVPELSKNFKVVTFDPRGVARSTLLNRSAVSIEAIADDIKELLDESKIERAHVLGISFGGFVAQKFALSWPDRLNRLILASTSFGGPKHVAPSMEVLTAFASTEGLNTPGRIRKYLSVAFSPRFVEEHPQTVDEFCDLREANVVPEDVYMQQLRSAMTFNSEPAVADISAPTLIVTGSNDTVVPMENSANLSRAVPRSRLQVIEGAGHMAFVEKAAEFNEIATEFLLEK